MSRVQTSAGSTGRIVFIDQARALAILLMLVGHSLDQFLGEPARSGVVYQEYQFVRGISSVLFLMVSGFSFVIASFNRFDDYMHSTPRLTARLRRIALILFLGYVLHLWAPTLQQSIQSYSAEHWERLVRFDVLQNIGFGLALLHLTLRVAGSPDRFWKIAVCMLLVVLVLARITYRPDVDALLPVSIGAMVNRYHGSLFPVIPYTGYLLFGSVFGYWFWRLRHKGDEWKVVAVAAALAVVLIVMETAIRRFVQGGIFPYSTPMKYMPGNTFARAGCAILAISGLYALGRYRLVLPRVAFILSKDALAVYFVHLLLVYGTASIPFMFPSYVRGMSSLQVGCWIGGLILAMTAMAYGIGWIRNHRTAVLVYVRHVVILAGILSFVLWLEMTVVRVALSAAISVAVVLFVHRARPSVARGRKSLVRTE